MRFLTSTFLCPVHTAHYLSVTDCNDGSLQAVPHQDESHQRSHQSGRVDHPRIRTPVEHREGVGGRGAVAAEADGNTTARPLPRASVDHTREPRRSFRFWGSAWAAVGVSPRYPLHMRSARGEAGAVLQAWDVSASVHNVRGVRVGHRPRSSAAWEETLRCFCRGAATGGSRTSHSWAGKAKATPD